MASSLTGISLEDLLGTGIGLLGSSMTGSTQRNAGNRAQEMAQYQPFNTQNLFGGVDFSGNQINQQLAPWAQQLSQYLQQNANGAFGTGLRQQGTNMMTGAAGQMPGLFDQAQNFGMPDEALYNSTIQGQQGIAGGMMNLFNQSGSNPYALEQMQRGRDYMSNSYADVEARRLGLLREGAAPFEQRATDSLFQRMYGQGRMGSTGGGRDIESFARGLGMADTSRQLDAMNFSEGLYGRDQTAGANLFSGGVGNYMQGLRDTANIGNMAMDAYGRPLQTAIDWNQLGYTRANDRIARAQNQFGFGENVSNTDTRNAAGSLGLLSGLTEEQRLQAGLGLTAGAANSQAGIAQGNFEVNGSNNPLGSALTGLGTGLLTSEGPGALAGAIKGGIAGFKDGGLTGMLSGAGKGLLGLGGAPAAAGAAGAIGTGLQTGGILSAGGANAALTSAAEAGMASANAALGGATGVPAAGGGLGSTLGALATNPVTWAVGAALAAGLVLDKNLPSSSPLDKFDTSSGGWTKSENFANTTFAPSELNSYYGPALKVFAQTGDVRKALASLAAPQDARQKILAERAYHLFSGTGNPMRQIAKANNFGEGEWTASNSGKQKLIEEIKAGATSHLGLTDPNAQTPPRMVM